MKTFLNIILGTSILFGFSQCGNSKDLTNKLQEEISFKIYEATYQSWVAGVAGGGGGINVIFKVSDFDSKDIQIDSLFFRGQMVKVERKITSYVGRFKSNINRMPDIIMSGETDAEYGNKAPTKKPKFPFEIEDDEAIISYKEKGIHKYFKIKLNKAAPQQYP